MKPDDQRPSGGDPDGARLSAAGDVVIVLCTTSEAQAGSLADALLAAGLVACVNLVGPVESRYLWEGRAEVSREMLSVMKTTRARLAELTAAIVAAHEYELPEILVLPVDSGLEGYLGWVARSCGGATG